jgi:hypothetical protein
MSDFLSNLVFRSSGAASVIQPRLPSLFEPTTPHAGSFTPASSGGDEGQRKAPTLFEDVEVAPAHSAVDEVRVPAALRVDDPSAGRSAAQERQAPAISDRSLPPFKSDFEEVRDRSLPALEARSDEASVGRNLRPSVARREELAREPLYPRPKTVPAPREPTAVDLIAPTDLPESNSAVLKRSSAPPAPPIIRGKRDDRDRPSSDLKDATINVIRQLSQTTEPEVEVENARAPFARIQGSVTRTPASIGQPTAPRFEFARNIPPPKVARPEPDIQISIGRIEVRAVSQQPTMQKERPASPVMSLKDYLLHRSKQGGT